MEGPVDVRVHAYTPARLFTLDEANGLLARISEIFTRTDPKLVRLRELEDLVEDAESYWGSKGDTMPPDELHKYRELVAAMEDVRLAIDADLDAIRAIGCEVKDVSSGLVDFPAIIEGGLAYLCWQRGEPRIANWHTLEGGFAGRKPLKTGPRAER